MENPLHLLLNPRSIATVGAGNNPMKMGTIQALSIVKDGYKGKIYPVHPVEHEVLGHQAYPSVSSLPEAPDLAMFIVPTDQVVPLMEEFGKIGTKRAIVITAGFRETGTAGAHMELELIETARRYGIRFLGPNCMGIINSAISLNVTVMPLSGPPGLLGMATQSGTYVTQTLPYLKKRGIRFSKTVSVGNEADLDIVDALEYLGEDEQTKAIALYIEGIRDGKRFIETARRITPHKPIVAQYVGGSAAGARAGSSHTGSMAGPDHIYDGIFKQAGIIRVHSVEELYSHGWALATQPPLKGRRIAVVTNSGGPGTAMSHTCNTGGLEIPAFSPGLQEQIREHIAPHASAGNPVDLTFHLDTKVLCEAIPAIIMESGEVDGVVLHGAMGSGFMRAVYPHLGELMGGSLTEEEFLEQFKRDLSGIAALPRKYDLPLMISSFFDREDSYTAYYQDHDIPVFDAPEKTARGMLALLRYKEVRERQRASDPVIPAPSAEAAAILAEAVGRGEANLNEYDSKRLLAAYGIPVCREGLIVSEDEGVALAGKLGYPVAVKACSHLLPHKSGKGLIHLNVGSEEQLRSAIKAIREQAGSAVPLLVSEMVKGEREFVAGVAHQPAFGPCVMFGLGGIFTEALKDASFRASPLNRPEALEMLSDLRSKELLGAFRGLSPVNTDALTSLLQALSFIPLLHPEVKEIDLNPIIIAGAQPVVVDALLIIEP